MARDKQSQQSCLLGTSVKITVKLSINTADTATITIEDPTQVERASDANMTKEANRIYSYIFQSSTSWDYGDYLVTIEVTSGAYTSVIQDTFKLLKQD